MSSDFESAFKNWLTHREEGEEDNVDEDDEGIDNMQRNDHDVAEERAPHSDGETSEEDEDLNEMPILQKMIDLPSKQTLEHVVELGPSPPPPSLQKSHSVRSDFRNDEQKDVEHIAPCKSRPSQKVRSKASSHSHKNQPVCEKYGQQHRTKGFRENMSRKENIQIDQKFPLTNCRKSLTASKSSFEEAYCYPSPVHLTVDHDGINSYHNSSPSSPCCFGDASKGQDLKSGHITPSSGVADSDTCLGRELRKGCMLSPERDLVEPDSTSEIFDSPNVREYQEGRRVELNRMNPGVRRTKITPSLGRSAEVTVHVTDEGVGECDSTSMFLASPSAISPASQGEIEERMCPLMADHEDSGHNLTEWGAGHCICQCHGLATPPHMSLIRQETSCSSGNSKNSQTACHLVKKNRHPSRDSLPRLEKMPACLSQNESPDVERTGSEICESPPVLGLPELDLRGERTETSQLVPQVHQGVLLIKAEPVEAPPLLVKYEVEQDKAHDCRHHNDILGDFTFDESPPVLVLPMKEHKERPNSDSGKKHSSRNKRSSGERRKQARSPPCLTKYEAKPSESGIVLKLRAKRPVLNPEMLCSTPKPEPRNDTLHLVVAKQKAHSLEQTYVDHKAEQEIIPESGVSEKILLPPKQEPEQDLLLRLRPATRRRHTVDSPEFVRSLRRRKRSSELEQAEGDSQLHNHAELCEEVLQEREDLEPRGKRQKAGLGGSACSCCLRSSPRRKRRRRNTIHLGDPLSHLSPAQQDFVLFSLKLSRLQTCTHNLVCTLFPRLAPALLNLSPESQQFLNLVDDIIGSLQRSELEENNKDSADLSCLMETLSLVENDEDTRVPIFLPQVVVCQSPQHSLEEFQDKVCTMLQLLLPDITVSLSDNLFHTSEELELLLQRVIAANTAMPTKKD